MACAIRLLPLVVRLATTLQGQHQTRPGLSTLTAAQAAPSRGDDHQLASTNPVTAFFLIVDKHNCCIYSVNMKSVINIKTDPETKEQAQKLAADLGVTLSTIINVYLKQFIRTKEFTFSLAYQMSPELEKIIVEAEADIMTGKNLSPAFDQAEDALVWLEKSASERLFS